MRRRSKREIERLLDEFGFADGGVEGIPREDDLLRRDVEAILAPLDEERAAQLADALDRLPDDLADADVDVDVGSPAMHQLHDALEGGPVRHPAHEEGGD